MATINITVNSSKAEQALSRLSLLADQADKTLERCVVSARNLSNPYDRLAMSTRAVASATGPLARSVEKLISGNKTLAVTNERLGSSIQKIISAFKKLESENKRLAASLEKVSAAISSTDKALEHCVASAYDLSRLYDKLAVSAKTVASATGPLARSVERLISENRALAATNKRLESSGQKIISATKKLESENKQLATSLKKVSAATRSVEKSTRVVGGLFGELRDSADSLLPRVMRVTASYMAMRAALHGLINIGETYQEFEDSMIRVGAITSASAEEFEGLQQAARLAGQTTIWTAEQSAQALKILGQAGLSATESVKALPGVLNLAMLGELDLDRATQIAIGTLNAFGVEIEGLSHVNDVLVSTAMSAVTTVKELGVALSYSAKVADLMGLSVEQTSALLGVLADSNIKGGRAGRYLATALTKTSKAAAYFNLGPGASFIDVLKAIREHGLSAAEAKKIFGQRAFQAAMILAEGLPKYDALVGKLQNVEGAADELATKIEGSLKNKLLLLKSAFVDIALEFIDAFNPEPLKRKIAETTQYLIEHKGEILKAIQGLVQAVGDGSKAIIKLSGIMLSVFNKTDDGLLGLWNDIPRPVKEFGLWSVLYWGVGGSAQFFLVALAAEMVWRDIKGIWEDGKEIWEEWKYYTDPQFRSEQVKKLQEELDKLTKPLEEKIDEHTKNLIENLQEKADAWEETVGKFVGGARIESWSLYQDGFDELGKAADELGKAAEGATSKVGALWDTLEGKSGGAVGQATDAIDWLMGPFEERRKMLMDIGGDAKKYALTVSKLISSVDFDKATEGMDEYERALYKVNRTYESLKKSPYYYMIAEEVDQWHNDRVAVIKHTKALADAEKASKDYATALDDINKTIADTQFRSSLIGLSSYEQSVKKINHQIDSLIKKHPKLADEYNKERKVLLDLAAAQKEYDKEKTIEGINEAINSAKFERSLIGLSNYERNIAKINHQIDLLIKKHPELSDYYEKERTELIATAEAQEEYNNSFNKMWREFKSSITGSISGALKGEFDSIKDFFSDMLNQMLAMWSNFVAQLMTKQVVLPIVSGIFGGMMGATGSAFGSSGAAGGSGSGLSAGLTAAGVWSGLKNGLAAGFSDAGWLGAQTSMATWLSDSAGLVDAAIGLDNMSSAAFGAGFAGIGSLVMSALMGGLDSLKQPSTWLQAGGAGLGGYFLGPLGAIGGGLLGNLVGGLFGGDKKPEVNYQGKAGLSYSPATGLAPVYGFEARSQVGSGFYGNYLKGWGEHTPSDFDKQMLSVYEAIDANITSVMQQYVDSVNSLKDTLPEDLKSRFDAEVARAASGFDWSFFEDDKNPDEASIKEMSEGIVSKLTGSLDEAFTPIIQKYQILQKLDQTYGDGKQHVATYSEQLASLNREFDNAVKALALLDSSETELNHAETLRGEAIAKLNRQREDTIKSLLDEKEVVDAYQQAIDNLNKEFDNRHDALVAMEATEAQLAQNEQNRAAALENLQAAEAQRQAQQAANLDLTMASIGANAEYVNSIVDVIQKHTDLNGKLRELGASEEQLTQARGYEIERLAEVVSSSDDFAGVLDVVKEALIAAGDSAEDAAAKVDEISAAAMRLAHASEPGTLTDSAIQVIVDSFGPNGNVVTQFANLYKKFVEAEQELIAGGAGDDQIKALEKAATEAFARLVAPLKNQDAALKAIATWLRSQGLSDSLIATGMANISNELSTMTSEVTDAVQAVATGVDDLVRRTDGVLAYLPKINASICMSTAAIERVQKDLTEDWGLAAADLRQWMASGGVDLSQYEKATAPIVETFKNFQEWIKAAGEWDLGDSTLNDMYSLFNKWKDFTVEQILGDASAYGEEEDPLKKKIADINKYFGQLFAKVHALFGMEEQSLDEKIQRERSELVLAQQRVEYIQKDIAAGYMHSAGALESAQERVAILTQRLADLTNTRNDLLKKEGDVVHELNSKLTAAIHEAEADARRDALSTAEAHLEAALQKEIDRLEKQASQFQEAADAWGDVAKTLKDTAHDIIDTALGALSPEAGMLSAKKNFELLLKKAKLGDIEAAGQLPEAARSYLDWGLKTAGSSVEYRRLAGQISASLLTAAENAENTRQSQLIQLYSVVNDHTVNSLEYYRNALEMLQSLNDSTMSVEDAMREYADAVRAQLEAGDTATDKEVLYYAYTALLQRLPDITGWNWYLDQLVKGNYTQQKLIDAFLHSEEYQAIKRGDVTPGTFPLAEGGVLTAGDIEEVVTDPILDLLDDINGTGGTTTVVLGTGISELSEKLDNLEGILDAFALLTAYTSLLGRLPDIDGWDWYIGKLTSTDEDNTLSVLSMLRGMMASEEYQAAANRATMDDILAELKGDKNIWLEQLGSLNTATGNLYALMNSVTNGTYLLSEGLHLLNGSLNGGLYTASWLLSQQIEKLAQGVFSGLVAMSSILGGSIKNALAQEAGYIANRASADTSYILSRMSGVGAMFFMGLENVRRDIAHTGEWEAEGQRAISNAISEWGNQLRNAEMSLLQAVYSGNGNLLQALHSGDYMLAQALRSNNNSLMSMFTALTCVMTSAFATMDGYLDRIHSEESLSRGYLGNISQTLAQGHYSTPQPVTIPVVAGDTTSTGGMTHDDAKEILKLLRNYHYYANSMNAKSASMSADMQRMLKMLKKWDNDGLPEERAA